MQYITIIFIIVWTTILELAALYRLNNSLFFLRVSGGYLYLLMKMGFAYSAGAILWHGFSYQNQYIVPIIAPLISVAIVETFLEKIGRTSTENSWGGFLEEFREDLAGKVMKMEGDWQVSKELKLATKLSTVLDVESLESELHILFLPGNLSIEEANEKLKVRTKGMSDEPSTKKRELAQLLVNENPKFAKTLLKKHRKIIKLWK